MYWAQMIYGWRKIQTRHPDPNGKGTKMHTQRYNLKRIIKYGHRDLVFLLQIISMFILNLKDG